MKKKKNARLQSRIDAMLSSFPSFKRRSGGSVSGFETRDLEAQLTGAVGGFLPGPTCTTFCNVSNAMIADDCGLEA